MVRDYSPATGKSRARRIESALTALDALGSNDLVDLSRVASAIGLPGDTPDATV